MINCILVFISSYLVFVYELFLRLTKKLMVKLPYKTHAILFVGLPVEQGLVLAQKYHVLEAEKIL